MFNRGEYTMSDKRKCILCGNADATVESYTSGWEVWSCPQCKGYEVNANDYDPEESNPPINDANKHILATYLYKHRNRKVKIHFEPDDVARICSEAPKTARQKLEQLLLAMYLEYNEIGHKFKGLVPAVGYARSLSELYGMYRAMCRLGWIELYDDETLEITVYGHEKAEELISTNIDSRKVFVAMGFKDDLLEACEKAIKPACTACGFDAFLISDKEHNNGITDEIIVAIMTSRFVIADFTYGNQGAYWEAGFAQGRWQEVIRCVKAEWLNAKDSEGNPINKLHFDISNYSTIIWEDHADLIRKLKARIRATIDGAKLED